MSGTMQTKLFKTVCKRAALMRAPYSQSSWTNNISPIKKKKSSSRSKKANNIPTKSIQTNNNKNKLINNKEDMASNNSKPDADGETNKKNN
ncbi:unnamed protein product [Rotaria sp. Silwood2]|nr:unnamed protein product [Rotaria sp. Silwood2]